MKRIKKNSLLGLLLMTALFFTFSACDGCKNQTDGQGEEPKEEIQRPAKIITVADAKMMYENYTKRRAPLIQRYEDSIDRRGKYDEKRQEKMDRQAQQMQQEKDSFDVARYGYYDLQVIKDYLAYIEQEAKKAGEDITTLRIYFSNYPDDTKYVHPRQNSFFLMPTVRRGNRDYGFFLTGDEQPKAVLLDDQLNVIDEPKGMGGRYQQNQKAEASFVPNLANPNLKPLYFQDGSLILNETEMVPPPH